MSVLSIKCQSKCPFNRLLRTQSYEAILSLWRQWLRNDTMILGVIDAEARSASDMLETYRS